MKMLNVAEARATLPAVLESVKRGEDIGIMAGNQIIQLKPIEAEPLNTPTHRGSPGAMLQALRGEPHLRSHDVDELDAAIESAKLPIHAGFILNEGK